MNNIIHSIHYFRQAEKKNNQSKYKRMYHDNSCITLTHPCVLYFFILLNDSYGFHIHVLPHGCAHDENTLHPDYTQVFHELYKKHSYYANENNLSFYVKYLHPQNLFLPFHQVYHMFFHATFLSYMDVLP